MHTAEFVDRGASLVDRLTTTQSPPPWQLVLVTAVLALVLVAAGPLWRITRNAVTIAHEGGHALVALVTGRRLDSITLHSDTSGLTVSRGKPYGPGMILTALAGYPAPPLLGLGFAALLAADRITLMLWTSIALLAAVLIKVRNLYGLCTVLALGALVFAVSWFGTDLVQAAFAYLAAWFLLFAGLRPVVEMQRGRRHRWGNPGGVDSDADQLAALTHLPALLWVLIFAAIALAALLYGGGLLLSEATGLCLPAISSGNCPAPG
ncbi:M50 family metallopeptidase [Nocardia farcinica]|uniref:M50 family metallopeptidase n=1 Tax=Nocardia TaxID=1817 RepID=UPI000BF037EE|nr:MULTISPECIES: M50 family metallopeptidase [Nocardia]MBF6184589.1 M50 family metallopeptidase [Nocardia farcinica]MBF6290303.1 M50 family metallopeptidase [Nocardia farcinica]MBF6310433.1 M50 family metallopeptidase [Nocardia farcinica]MBF6371923.1 M50 family metallopeptidase [Nocardia farcinica]MBF6377476.1 M50 family metallopeptidase [Nocardia farcinica]